MNQDGDDVEAACDFVRPSCSRARPHEPTGDQAEQLHDRMSMRRHIGLATLSGLATRATMWRNQSDDSGWGRFGDQVPLWLAFVWQKKSHLRDLKILRVADWICGEPSVETSVSEGAQNYQCSLTIPCRSNFESAPKQLLSHGFLPECAEQL